MHSFWHFGIWAFCNFVMWAFGILAFRHFDIMAILHSDIFGIVVCRRFGICAIFAFLTWWAFLHFGNFDIFGTTEKKVASNIKGK